MPDRPEHFDLDAIIVWPQPRDSAIQGWKVAVLNPATEEMITTVSRLTIHCEAGQGAVWAEAEMFAAPDGTHLMTGPVHEDGHGGCLTGTFRLRVAEMRVAAEPGSAWPDEAGKDA